ncbi:MAG: WYL domain-containing protein [Chitinophagales bacterium]|nr:WYL domain-containing protein [Chitinophagales bacterium]
MSHGENNKESSRKRMHFSPNLLSCMTNAVDNKLLLTIEYESRESESTTRKVEPMGLIYKNRKRHLVGWCKLREDWRTFRLDRVEMVKLHRDSFTPREGFNLSDFEVDDPSFEQEESEEN